MKKKKQNTIKPRKIFYNFYKLNNFWGFMIAAIWDFSCNKLGKSLLSVTEKHRLVLICLNKAIFK